MMKRLTIAVLACFMIAAVPGVAAAQEQPAPEQTQAPTEAGRAETETKWVETVKARALEAIEKRLVTLAELEERINQSETVQPNHAAKLMQDVRFSVKGLEDLAAEIRAATDLDTLRVLVPGIFEDYRVYAVIVPKAHLTLAADAAHAASKRLSELAGAIDDILERLAEAGFDVRPAEELLDEMIRLIDAGAEGAASVPDAVLDLGPEDYPGSTEVLRSAHADLQDAGAGLRSAGKTAHEIGRYIKSLFEGTSE